MRNMRKNWKKVFVMAFVLAFIVVLPTTVKGSQINEIENRAPVVIVINSNSELSSSIYVSGGNGTQSDPYIIENYNIDANGGGRAIYIGNTTKWVLIKNVHVYNASFVSFPYFPGAGIALFNTKNVIVEHSNITSSDRGVYIGNGRWNVVRFNSITNSSKYGVDLHSLSSSNTIWKNNISYNAGGVFLYSSSNNDIKNNEFYKNGLNHAVYVFYNSYVNVIEHNKIMYTHESGILLSGSSSTNPDGTKITQNEIYNNTVGIEINQVNNAYVSNNTIYNNTNYGVYLYVRASNVTVEYNHIFKNLKSAIYSISSSSYTMRDISINNNNISYNGNGIYFYRNTIYSVIHHNVIYNNTGYGISLSGSDVKYNRVYNNSFYYNHGSTHTVNSSHIQAFDSGTNNYWNETGRGNHWYDWTTPDNNEPYGIVDQPYKIDGSAGSADYYPLTESSTVPEFSSMWVLIVLIVLITSIFYKKK